MTSNQGNPQSNQGESDFGSPPIGEQWAPGQFQPQAQNSGGSGLPELASPWARLGARILDTLLLIVIAAALLVPIALFTGLVDLNLDNTLANETGSTVSRSTFADDFYISIWVELLVTAMFLVYEFYFLTHGGATLGKKAAGIKVIRENGLPVNEPVAARRLILQAISAIPYIGGAVQLIAGLATIIMIFADPRRQVPDDKIANTLVVRAR